MEYYVSVNGNDAYLGTEAQPFLTINHGVSVLGPGDLLYVKSGTYDESLWDVVPSGISWATPVALKAYPGDVVTIKPSSGKKVIRFTHSQYIIVDGFVLDGTNVEEEVIKITSEAHHIRIQNTEVRNAPSNGILINNVLSNYNELINVDVHDNGASGRGHGIYIESSNNLVDRCSIYHNAGFGVHIYTEGQLANNNIVSNNKIYDNGISSPGNGIILGSGKRNLAFNNRIWGNLRGIQIAYGAISCKAFNNTIFANTSTGIAIFDSSIDAEIRNNTIHRNGGQAIFDEGIGTIFDNNLIDVEDEMSVIMDLQAIEVALRQQVLALTVQADAIAQSIVDLQAVDDVLDSAADVIEAD